MATETSSRYKKCYCVTLKNEYISFMQNSINLSKKSTVDEFNRVVSSIPIVAC